MYKSITELDDIILTLLNQSVTKYLHTMLILTQSFD